MFGRQKIAMLVAEFLSAAVLSTVVLAMIGRTSFPFFVAVASAVTLGTMAYLFGTHTNPALTIGLWTMRKIQTTQAVVVVTAQMLGGLAAWQLNEYLLNSELKSMAGDAFDWRILAAEALGAFVFGLGVAAAVSRAYDSAKLAVVMGLSLFLGTVVATMAANGLLNPSVALGVQSWSWTYALGPVLGVVVGMSLYGVLFAAQATKVARTAAGSRLTTKKSAAKKKTTRKR